MSARVDLMRLLGTVTDIDTARDLVDLHHAEVLATAPSRARILREEMRNLRRIEREDTPDGALGTRTGLLRAALILDERAELAEEKNTAPAATSTPATDTEAYPGELAMLRGLLGVLRPVAQHGDMDEVRRLLAEHAADEQAAYAEGGAA